jgi:hypothetical protein
MELFSEVPVGNFLARRKLLAVKHTPDSMISDLTAVFL